MEHKKYELKRSNKSIQVYQKTSSRKVSSFFKISITTNKSKDRKKR
jgi:hypothetical protein